MKEEKKYPFKYLDPYNRDDKNIYFGREKEVDQLYEIILQSDSLLLFGNSGTGKTSLIRCGLANRFNEMYDWLPLSIRRGDNINRSLLETLNKEIGIENNDIRETDEETDNSLLIAIKDLWLKHFKPIYLIFDQFEELYILKNEKEKEKKYFRERKKEQETFYESIKQLLALDLPVKIIISIREEHLYHLYDFEKIVPDIFRKKMRIEPMRRENVKEMLEKICDIKDDRYVRISVKEGEKEEFLNKIFETLDPDEKGMVDLPCLQILFHKLCAKFIEENPNHSGVVEFSVKTLEDLGELGNILLGWLKELVDKCEKEYKVESKHIWSILTKMTTLQGTKRIRSKENICERVQSIEKNQIGDILSFFKDNRAIVRIHDAFEFQHDALAKQVYEYNETKIMIEKEMQWQLKDKEYYTKALLSNIKKYKYKLSINPEQEDRIKKSQDEIDAKEKEQDEKIKKERRTNKILKVVLGVLFLLLVALFLLSKLFHNQSNSLEEAKYKAEKLSKTYYLYDDKFGLTYGDIEDDEHPTEKRYYFIDSEGNEIRKFGKWSEAAPFEDYTALAKVATKGSGDKKEVYLLDTLGNKYLYLEKNDRKLESLDSIKKSLDASKVSRYLALNLSNSSLSDSSKIDTIIDSLKDYLKILYLDNLKLEKLPNKLFELKELTWLSLKNNELETLPIMDSFKKLKNLDLEGNCFKEFPQSICALNKLKALRMSSQKSNNEFKNIKGINCLKNLNRLDLGHNNIDSIDDEIGKLKELKKLSLYHNELKFLSDSIKNLQKLTFLDLGWNCLDSLPAVIYELKNLRELRLVSEAKKPGNDTLKTLKTLSPEIKNLIHLKVLDLWGNDLKNIPDKIEKLTELERLNLGKNRLTKLPDGIFELTKLRFLNLEDNKLRDNKNLKKIGKLKNLIHLYLFKNELTEFPSEIGKLKELRVLKLNENKIENASFINENGFQSLADLNLSENSLNEWSFIEKLPPSLTNLDLSYNSPLFEKQQRDTTIKAKIDSIIYKGTNLKYLYLYNKNGYIPNSETVKEWEEGGVKVRY